MKMPEGWKRHCDLKYADHQVDIDRIDAGILMKEMAECLEYCAKYYEYSNAENILKKFKEWK